MSSLIFFTDADQAAIATDTLACGMDHRPAFFTSKAFMLPHLRMVICGLGAGAFADHWFMMVNTRMAVRDIVGLDLHAPAALREMYASYAQRTADQSSTIYHFGFPADDGPLQVRAYRSTNNFASETLPYALGAKPECKLDDDSVEFPDRFRTMMDEQRQIQAGTPGKDFIPIGGEVQVIHLTRTGFQAWRQSQFDDYKTMMEMVLRRQQSGTHLRLSAE